jgi:hypothetical protein
VFARRDLDGWLGFGQVTGCSLQEAAASCAGSEGPRSVGLCAAPLELIDERCRFVPPFDRD